MLRRQPTLLTMRSLALGCLFLQRHDGDGLLAFTPVTPVVRATLSSSSWGQLPVSFHRGPTSSSSSSAAAISTSALALSRSPSEPPFPTWSYDKPCTTMAWNDLVAAQVTVASSPASLETATQADLVLVGVMAPAQPEQADAEEEEEEEEGKSSAKEPSKVSLSGFAEEVDTQLLGGALSNLMTEEAKSFKQGAKMGSMTSTLRVVVTGQNQTTPRLVAVGLGPAGNGTAAPDWTGAGGALGKAVANKCHAEKKVSSCHVILPVAMMANATLMTDWSTAFYETLYTDNRYKTGPKIQKPAEDLQTVTLIPDGPLETATLQAATHSLDRGRKIARGIILTKDIVNAPHNILNSLSLADTAKRIAAESGGRLKCTILSKKDCEKRGMGAYLGVARGSETEPQFIHVVYTPPVTTTTSSSSNPLVKLGVVGKGLLFDTGGYNIKTQMMEAMKFDCGGAAAVLGAARALAALEPAGVEVHFVVAACENMINAKAMVPSDILTASNGKTIEVMNTDAEGRLTLADALVFVDKEVGCDKIIELSTLTGACMVSLGKDVAGVWTSNDNLAKELEAASKVTTDKIWRMPLVKEYNEQLESKFADLKNIGTKYGGAITAALFLQHFVSRKKPFAHIDIAGPVWSEKNGATGYGAKLIVEWVQKQATGSS